MQGIAFGPTLRLLRLAKGISLRRLSRQLGVSPAFLSQIEAEERYIPRPRIVQVADRLGVSVGYLLGTARQLHPDVVEFLRETPEAAEFMITAMQSGLAAEDFADLRKALKDRRRKGFVRRATLQATGRKRKRSRKEVGEDLVSYLDPHLCLTSVIAQNKDRLFQRFVKSVSKRKKSLPPDIVLPRLEKRERQAPTSIGGGVAIPHALVPDLDQPIIGAVSLKRTVPFSTGENGRVKTVFFVIGDETKPQFLISMLARIARLCSTPEFLDAFAGARTHRELYKTILHWDRRIGSG